MGRCLAALATQDYDGDWDVVLVDDGSDDDTVAVARASGLERLGVVPGPGTGAADARNAGVAATAAERIAFTDADCFPTPGWLREGVAALEEADLVQGRVMPDPAVELRPFDRTLWVEGERGYYETANLFVRRELFDRLGGFEDWLDTGAGKMIAEDVWFGWRAVRSGARTAFAERALAHHAVFSRGPAGFVAERLRLRYFPAIAARVPEFRRRPLFGRVFLSYRSAAFDAAALGTAVAATQRNALPLLAAVPYAAIIARSTRRFRKRAPLVAVVYAAADAVALGALVAGSVRWRSPVL